MSPSSPELAGRFFLCSQEEDGVRSFKEVGEGKGWTLSSELGKLEVSGDLGREILRVSLQR